MNIYLRKVASEGINHHVEHCIFVPASRVLFSSRCPTFRVSLLSSIVLLSDKVDVFDIGRFRCHSATRKFSVAEKFFYLLLSF